MAEFTLLSNQFRAEYGHSSGGQFNTIVKSGTNDLHFMIYDYLRNGISMRWTSRCKNGGIYSNSALRFQNRLGANVGGHIIRNKWFYLRWT